eukprot:6212146-Pleurochrysis_carterae.AAC.6
MSELCGRTGLARYDGQLLSRRSWHSVYKLRRLRQACKWMTVGEGVAYDRPSAPSCQSHTRVV